MIENWELNYRLSSVIKYISRCDYKGTPIQDLEKALWFLQRDIAKRKKAEARLESYMSAQHRKHFPKRKR